MTPDLSTPTGQSWITWQSPDGSSWNLTDTPGGLWAQPGIVGFGAGPRTVVSDDLPAGYGLVRSTVPGPRTITIPLYLRDGTMGGFLARRAGLFASFTATGRMQQLGQLVVTRPDGSSRQIDCWYQAGFEGASDRGLPRQLFALQLLAPYPWYDVQPQQAVFPYIPARPYLNPYETVAPSTALGASTLFISGDLPTPALWWFDGPFSAVTAIGPDGQFTITRPCAAGERWTVNTDPQGPLAQSSDGTNLMPFLNWPAGRLWQFQPGANSFAVGLTGAQVGTVATLNYQIRWDSP